MRALLPFVLLAASVTAAIGQNGTADIVRPLHNEPPIDDVNWFARPVPDPQGHKIVAFASHNLNYLYDLTTGQRIRIPDRSDAVATPDGRYITVPSHYTDTHTVNFYELAPLRERLQQGRDAADAPPFSRMNPPMSTMCFTSRSACCRTTRAAESNERHTG